MDSEEKPGRLLELVGIAALSLAAISFVATYFTGPFVPTKATVTSTFLVTPSELAKPLSHASLESDPSTRRYTRVLYKYEVDGRTYLGESESKACVGDKPKRIADNYPAGRTMTVYVSRTNPGESHLWRNSPSNESFLILLGIGSYILAFLCHKYEPVARFFALTDEHEELEDFVSPVAEPGEPLIA